MEKFSEPLNLAASLITVLGFLAGINFSIQGSPPPITLGLAPNIILFFLLDGIFALSFSLGIKKLYDSCSRNSIFDFLTLIVALVSGWQTTIWFKYLFLAEAPEPEALLDHFSPALGGAILAIFFATLVECGFIIDHWKQALAEFKSTKSKAAQAVIEQRNSAISLICIAKVAMFFAVIW